MEDTVKMNDVQEIACLLEEHKGEETLIIDVRGECSWANYFIITTVRSQAHLAGMGRHLNNYFKEHKLSPVNRHKSIKNEGWVLLDCGDIIIHLMEKEQREFYELEKLWFKGKIAQPLKTTGTG